MQLLNFLFLALWTYLLLQHVSLGVPWREGLTWQISLMLLSTFYYPSLSLYHQFYMNMNNGFKGKLSMNKQKCLEVANNIEKSWITDLRSLIDMRDVGDIWYHIYEIWDIWEIRHLGDTNSERSEIWETRHLKDKTCHI